MKKLLIGLLALSSLSTFASSDLKGSISAQASAVFATADGRVSKDQAVCFEFGKLLGLGMAYRVTQPGAPLEDYINETVAMYGENCKGRRLSRLERNEISELAKSIYEQLNE